MTDPLEPNDLSHLSDEEFNALCPIGHHAPGPEPLSPAAQAVLDAWLKSENGERMLGDPACLAAALRAAADQVVPEPDDAAKETFSIAALRHRWQIRDQFLAIAAELEGADQATSSTH